MNFERLTARSNRAFKELLRCSLTIRVRPRPDRSEDVSDIGSGWATIESSTPLMTESSSLWWSLWGTDETCISSQLPTESPMRASRPLTSGLRHQHWLNNLFDDSAPAACVQGVPVVMVRT